MPAREPRLGAGLLGLLGLLAALAVGYVVYLAAVYYAYPGYLDHGEPVNLLIAWRLLAGEQVYPAFAEPGRVTNIYGPLYYAALAAFLKLAGASLASGKLPALIAVVALPPVVALGQRRQGLVPAVVAAILAAGFVLLNTPLGMLTRPDALIALLVAVALWVWRAGEGGADREVAWRAALIAVLAGAAANMKIYTGIVFVPILLAYLHGRSWRMWGIAIASGAATVLLPFALPPFSLAGYLSWMPAVAGKSSTVDMLAHVAKYLPYYLVPVVIYLLARTARQTGVGRVARRRDDIYVAAYLAAIALATYPAAKPGAGYHYLFPFAPIAIDMMLRFVPREPPARRRLAIGLVCLCAIALVVLRVPVQKRIHRAFHWDVVAAVRQEIREIMRDHPGRTIEMGIGQDVVSYHRTFYKTDLVLAGHPYTFDSAVMIEMSFLGRPLSAATVDLIRTCATDLWLIPRGDRPFDLIGYYGNRVFDDAFRAAFHGSYELRSSRQYFDIWGCRAKPGSRS